MTGMLTLEALQAEVAGGAIDTVLACQVDMQGRLMGKRFQAEFFVEHAWEETHSCNYLLATDMEMETVPGYRATSWARGYGDYVMRPDLGTLRRTPWLEGTALVLCDVLDHHTGQEVAHSPRAILRRQVARLEARGIRGCMASELEFFLFEEGFGVAQARGYRGLTPSSAYNEDYHIFQTTKDEDVMRAIRTGLQGAGVPVESSKGEASAGQMELNVRYADPLAMADRHVVVKNACREIAFARGRSVTFMAKWHDEQAGSSAHVHQSLRTLADGRPLFFDADAEHGLSELARRYLAGQLHHARGLAYFLAPYVNSYKRFQAGTFAPTRAVWSVDNRTAGYRLCAPGTEAVRIECRIGGADLNPYLAFAALIAAGLDGVERELPLEAPFTGDAYRGRRRAIPDTLREATVALARSRMLRAAFGDEVIEHYLHAARWEQAEHDRRVTDRELVRGFERA